VRRNISETMIPQWNHSTLIFKEFDEQEQAKAFLWPTSHVIQKSSAQRLKFSAPPNAMHRAVG